MVSGPQAASNPISIIEIDTMGGYKLVPYDRVSFV
jgi:hypothetical protein